MKQLSEIEKAQIAMAVDCDGFIALRYQPRHGPRGSFAWSMGVNNKAPELVDYFYLILPLNSVIYNNHSDRTGGYYGWFVRQTYVIPLIEQVAPYLVIKQPQARLALEYKQTILPEGWRKLLNRTHRAKNPCIISPTHWQLRWDIYHKMTKANARYKYVGYKAHEGMGADNLKRAGGYYERKK